MLSHQVYRYAHMCVELKTFSEHHTMSYNIKNGARENTIV